jgi:hypothetical protein
VPSSTWTPRAVASRAARARARLWRAVEAQHVPTLRLVDGLEEQRSRGHIGSEQAAGSRPRGARTTSFPPSGIPPRARPLPRATDPGVFYGAERVHGVRRAGLLALAIPVDSGPTARAGAPDAPEVGARALAVDRKTALLPDARSGDTRRTTGDTGIRKIARAEIGLIRYASVRDPGGRAARFCVPKHSVLHAPSHRPRAGS